MKVMKINFVGLPKEYHDCYPFKNGDRVLFLGEIENMTEHCVIVTEDGKTLWGYHTEHLTELTEEEFGL